MNNEDLYREWVAQCGFGNADTPALRRNYNSGTDFKVDVPSDDSTKED